MKFDTLMITKWNRFLRSGMTWLKENILTPKAEEKRITVCDLGRSKIVLLEVVKTPAGELFIEKFEHIHNTFQDQRPALLLKPFFADKKFSREGIRVTMTGHGVVIRFIRFPKMKPEDLRSAMKYEVEQYIPFELKDCVLDYAVLDESVKTPEGERTEVLLAVAKRQELEPTLEVFRNLECKLAVIDMDILSAMSALEFFYPEDFAGHVGLLDVGTEMSTLGVVREGKPRFIRDISYGTYDIQKRLRSHLNLPAEEINRLLEKNEIPAPPIVAAIAESMEGLIGDLKVSFDYYRDQGHFDKPLQKLFITGDGAFHPAVLKSLSQGLGIPIAGLEVLSKLKWADTVDADQLRKHEAFLPVPIGLALRPE